MKKKKIAIAFDSEKFAHYLAGCFSSNGVGWAFVDLKPWFYVVYDDTEQGRLIVEGYVTGLYTRKVMRPGILRNVPTHGFDVIT